jgi:predicted transcriptional regulator
MEERKMTATKMEATIRYKPDGRKRRRHLDEVEVTGALDENRKADGRRKINLTKGDRRALTRQARVEAAVALFLDLETGRTWAEIAQELGISVMALKDLTKTEEFIACYNQHFAEQGHDPRLRSSQAALVDMLPEAIKQLKEMLTNPGTPAGVRLKVIERVIQLNGMTAAQQQKSDQGELAQFLRGINVEGDLNVNLANPFANQIQSYVDGRYEEIPAHETAGNPLGDPARLLGEPEEDEL